MVISLGKGLFKLVMEKKPAVRVLKKMGAKPLRIRRGPLEKTAFQAIQKLYMPWWRLMGREGRCREDGQAGQGQIVRKKHMG